VHSAFTPRCRGLAVKAESNPINEKLMAGFSADQVKSMINRVLLCIRGGH
jgi:hypothetical protein